MGCVNPVQLSLRVLEPDTIAETPGNEVDRGNIRVGDVLAFIHRKTRLTVRHEGVLEIAEPVKRVYGRAQRNWKSARARRFVSVKGALKLPEYWAKGGATSTGA